MSKKKFAFYAVRSGHKPGIYATWEECSAQVHGYPNALYKGFHSIIDAETFLKADDRSQPSDSLPLPENKAAHLKKVVIYADGACIGNPGPGGYAVVMIYGTHRKESKGGFRLTTNNRMEIMAALVGLGMLKTKCSVTICTDSQYLVDAMTKGWAMRWRANGWRTLENRNVANVDLWKQLLEQYDKHIVTFEWIRGHQGNKENERCDQLSTHMASSKYLPADTGYESQFTSSEELSLYGK